MDFEQAEEGASSSSPRSQISLQNKKKRKNIISPFNQSPEKKGRVAFSGKDDVTSSSSSSSSSSDSNSDSPDSREKLKRSYVMKLGGDRAEQYITERMGDSRNDEQNGGEGGKKIKNSNGKVTEHSKQHLTAACISAEVVQQAMNAWSMDRLEEAEIRFVKALQIIYSQVKGAPPSVRPGLMLDIASILHNRGLICRSQGQLQNAQKHLTRAFAIFQKLGADEPEVLLILNSIAQLYIHQGRVDEALPLIKRAVALNSRTYGAEHARVADSLNDLSLLYTKQQNWPKAAECVRKVITIHSINKRGTDVHTLRLKNSLALLLDKAGNKDEAEQVRREVLQQAEDKYGKSHPTVLKHLMNVARVYEIEQKFAPAESLHTRCLSSFSDAGGMDSPDVATTMFSLAALYVAQGKFDRAYQLLHRCLNLRKKHYGERHHVVADVYSKMAVVQWGCAKFVQAEKSMARAVDIFCDVVGKEHEVVRYAQWMLDAIRARKPVCITR